MFSNSTQYAIRAVLFLSRERGHHKRLKVDDIAENLSIPKAFLSKILQQLSRNKIISSAKGRGGGFYLTDDNINRPLMDIVICMEGHDVFDKCILGLPECGDANPCHLHKYYKIFKGNLSKIIKDVSIEDLLFDDLENHYKL